MSYQDNLGQGVVANRDLGALVTHSNASAGVSSNDFDNWSGRGCKVIISVTAITATTYTVTIEGRDATANKTWTILQSANITTTGTTVLTVYPGLTAAANVTASDVLPRNFRITTNIAGGNVTSTVTAQLVV